MNMEEISMILLFFCLITTTIQVVISKSQKEMIRKQKELIQLQEDSIKKQDSIIADLENKIKVKQKIINRNILKNKGRLSGIH